MKKFEHENFINEIKEVYQDRLIHFEKANTNPFIYYDRIGNPISSVLWNILSDYAEYFVIKREKYGKYLIYTCWHGTEKLRFEIRVIDRDNNYALIHKEPHNSEDDALHGHEKILFLMEQKLFRQLIKN